MMTLEARAKINLCLDITGKRGDGYHLLETVMHTVSLCDRVTLDEAGSGISISCTDGNIPTGRENIAYKCAEAFFSETGIKGRGVNIAIEKNIPSQAGLGGGSADGAAVLRGMNVLFGAGLTDKELCGIGARIGADIPFCVTGGCGYCTGIGDIIEPLPLLSGTVLIGKGGAGISTGEAYARIDSLGRGIGMKNVREIFSQVSCFEDIAPYCRNIFEEVADVGDVAAIKAIMNGAGAVCSCMTGSGSAVFGLFDGEASAEKAADILKNAGYFSELCRLC